MHTATPPSFRYRLAGLDVARALAVIGMVMVHVGPTEPKDLATQLYTLTNGRASVLFVLLAGIGVALLADARGATPARTVVDLAWRALVLLPLGLALQAVVTAQYVILPTYAALFVIAIATLHLPTRVLPGIVAIGAIAGPLVFLVGRVRAPDVFDRGPLLPGEPVAEIVHGLLLSGPYPIVVWLVPFLLGLWLGRRDLRAAAVHTRLIVGGASVAVAATGLAALLQAHYGDPGFTPSWELIISARPHSQMPLWLATSGGVAVAVVGLCLALTASGRGRPGPLAALGRTALTFYVLHLLVIAVWPEHFMDERVLPALAMTAGLSGAGMAGALVWLRHFRQGPLEAVLRGPRQWHRPQ